MKSFHYHLAFSAGFWLKGDLAVFLKIFLTNLINLIIGTIEEKLKKKSKRLNRLIN